MKHFLIILAAIFLVSCTDTTQRNNEKPLLSEIDSFNLGNKIFFIDSSTKSEFDALNAEKLAAPESSESVNLSNDASLVSRNGDTLSLKLTNGNTASLVDNKADSDSFVVYKYLGRITAIGHFVCFASLYEGYSYVLVNASTGEITYTCGAPTLSPDNRILIAANADLEAAFTYNGFEMFLVEGSKLKQVGTRELHKWGPNKIKWKTNSELLVERISPASASRETEKTDYIKITIK